jgi:DnaK suppressor protein
MTKKKKQKFTFPQAVLEPVKTFLTEELNKITKQVAQVEKDDPFANEDRVNENAKPDMEADEQFGHARAKAISGQLNKKIIQIKKALARVKVGQYGICEKCGKFINTKRLMVYPETTKCVKCREKEV